MGTNLAISPAAADLARQYKEAPIGLCFFIERKERLEFSYINDWLAELNGLTVEEHLGRTIAEVLPDVAAGVEQQLRAVLLTGKPIIGGTVEAETAAKPGVRRKFKHNYFRITGEDGTVIGVSCAVYEIAESASSELIARLTPRESEVFERLVVGAKTIIIAQEFGISPRTVEKHRAQVMKKLGARNLAELVRIALSGSPTAGARTGMATWRSTCA